MNLERDVKRAERLRKTICEAIYELECAIAPDKWTKDLIAALKMLDEAENLAWIMWLSAQLRYEAQLRFERAETTTRAVIWV